MKATEQYFPVMVMFITLYKVVLIFFETVKNSCSVRPIQMKTSSCKYFPMVLLIMLYKVARTFESFNKILQCHPSNEASLAVRSHGTLCFSVFWKVY